MNIGRALRVVGILIASTALTTFSASAAFAQSVECSNFVGGGGQVYQVCYFYGSDGQLVHVEVTRTGRVIV